MLKTLLVRYVSSGNNGWWLPPGKAEGSLRLRQWSVSRGAGWEYLPCAPRGEPCGPILPGHRVPLPTPTNGHVPCCTIYASSFPNFYWCFSKSSPCQQDHWFPTLITNMTFLKMLSRKAEWKSDTLEWLWVCDHHLAREKHVIPISICIVDSFSIKHTQDTDKARPQKRQDVNNI